MLCDDNFDKTEVKDVIARVFEIDDKDKALSPIDEHTKLWMKVVGTRGYVGKKTVNASIQNLTVCLGGIMKSPVVGMGIGQLYFKVLQMKWAMK